MNKMLQVCVLAILLSLGLSVTADAERLPVGDFFKDSEFTSVSLSPTGEYITVSIPQDDRTILAAFRVSDMKLIAKWDYGAKKHIESVRWVNNERFLLYVTVKLGRFDFKVGAPDVFATNVDGTKRADMPNLGFYNIEYLLWDDPKHILVSRSVESAFLSKYNVYDGRVTTVATAPLRAGSFILDHDGKVRYAVGQQKDLESQTLRREGDDWRVIHSAKMGGEVRSPWRFDAENKRVYFSVSENGEPDRLVLLDPETNVETPVSANPNVDLAGGLVSSDGKHLLAVRYADGLPGYEFINKEHPESKTYAGLINAFPDHAVSFAGVSRDGRYVLFGIYSDVDPGSYYMFDREKGEAKFLLAARDWIKPEQMSFMRPIQLKARDGTTLHGYLTVPRNGAAKNLPLILHPHGGPHFVRDDWGFSSEVQFLANRGYAVLQVNFRGSGGYGTKFEGLGFGRWGTTMVDDMADAVDWVVGQGIADKNRVCTYGASYGGYAALQSVVRYPDKFRCAIGYVGVYSLDLLYTDGSSDTPESRAFLDKVIPVAMADRQAQSPLFNIDRIRVPVMLVHGAKDEIVPIVHYNRLKKALEEAGKPPEVTVVEDKEGHGFYDYQNQVDLYTKMEAFLDKHIGATKPSTSP